MYSRKHISFNSFFIFLEKICKMITYFVVGVIVAREVGPNVFGLYSSILSVSVILAAIAALGLNSLLAKEFISNSNLNLVASNSLIIRFSSCVLFSLISLLVYKYVLKLSTELSLLSSMLIMLTMSQVVDVFFESRLKNKIVSAYKVNAYFFGAALKIYSAVYLKSIYALVFSQVMELFLVFSVGLICFFRLEKSVVKHIDLSIEYTVNLLKKSFPLMLSSIAVIIYMKVDQVLVLHILDERNAGLYAAATRLVEGCFVFSMIVMPSLFPNMIKLHGENFTEFNVFIGKVFVKFAILGLIVSVLVFLLSSEIVNLVYGVNYTEASNVLAIYALSIPIVYIGDLFSRWLIITDNLVLSILRHSFGLIINLSLNLLLIPVVGIEGAAVASVCGYLSSVVLFSLISSRARSFYMFMK
ncbi:flippase [Aliikangiella marina]|uniref:Flippase n=1 Tax=Aliikangiella marina TaxID=1712262 RepID=A0A545TIJ1_9GAMM|nr:flippase [Aliikangiella marina]TQV77027.1 flippase [Aliikangiella marina]